ncbi:keratin, type II cytoskeletal 2 epidermal [Eucalyptus grandis]|uniref:Uncharacterized protein n=2 Tax=Eucalyptus grandis TaxID=71139 RepID=A0ACC3L3N5_EUCGR|nr:keratin, type II cytoskeletal 2 epidermal [Eucalyptus grandis]KAK3433174.1 hypothetical protein EUGRSUZ_D00694 [Eucalyptus grandis]
MGCCVSTHDAPSSSDHKKRAQVNSADSRAPPPPSVDEETVKEVLSETPTCPKPKPDFPALARHQKSFAADELSEEVSEVCSLSETMSTATNLTDDGGGCGGGGGGGRAKQRAGNRSPAKLRGPPAAKSRSLPGGDVGGRNDHGSRSRVPGGSPARRSDRSPGRANAGGSLRMVQGRDPGSGSFRATPARGGRPDPGERSGRRSMSPAASRAESRGVGSAGPAVGRTQSARRTNPSPGRVRPAPAEGRNREGRGGGKRMSSGNESLDNPLVSLECFIFL